MANSLGPDRFGSTVPYYVAGRPRYAQRLIEWLASDTDLSRSSRVLDLGCGPGFLAVPLARHAGTVIGIDPNAAMLEAARAEAERAGVAVEWRLGSSFDLCDDLAPLDLVVMGRSFHWMDRDATLARLDRLVTRGGAVALLHTEGIGARESLWLQSFEALREEFGREDDQRRLRHGPDWDWNAVVLLHSVFSDVTSISVFERRESSLDELMARVLSYSGSSPAVLGERRSVLEKTLRERMLAIRPDGVFPETVASVATIARRPAQ
jgi:SAM-dependent methyltransferase